MCCAVLKGIQVLKASKVSRVLRESRALKDPKGIQGLKAFRVFRVFRAMRALRALKVSRVLKALRVTRGLNSGSAVHTASSVEAKCLPQASSTVLPVLLSVGCPSMSGYTTTTCALETRMLVAAMSRRRWAPIGDAKPIFGSAASDLGVGLERCG